MRFRRLIALAVMAAAAAVTTAALVPSQAPASVAIIKFASYPVRSFH